MSDMCGGKANTVAALAQELGLTNTRFDYAAHGQSTGNFRDQTISSWLADAIAVYERFADGPTNPDWLLHGRMDCAAPEQIFA